MNTLTFPVTVRQLMFISLFVLLAGNAFGQSKGKTGQLQVIRLDGKIELIPFNSGLTIRIVDCDRMVINQTVFTNINKVIPPSCDSITTSVIETFVPLNPQHLSLTLYPNPSRGQVRLLLQSTSDDIVTIQIFNVLGVCVHEFEPMQINNSSLEIDWNFKSSQNPNVASGLYYIRAVTSRGIVTRSIEYFH